MTGPELPSGPRASSANSAEERLRSGDAALFSHHFTEREQPKELGLRAEIDTWRALITEIAHVAPMKSLQELESVLARGIPPRAPPAWVEQPLYSNLVLRRMMRSGLHHFCLSHDAAVPSTAFVVESDKKEFLRAKFPNSPEVSLYRASVNGLTVYFVGSQQSDGSIGACEALYLPSLDAEGLRPVSDLEELLRVFGVSVAPASTEAVIDAVSGHLESLEALDGLRERSARWCALRGRGRAEPVLSFLARTHDGSVASAAAMNAFLEGTMHERHPAFHSYVNQLPREFRPDTLEPVSCALFSLDPSRLQRLHADENAAGACDGRLIIHPVTERQLPQIAPWLSQQPRTRIGLLPSVSGRSGLLHDGAAPLSYQVKLDLPTWMSGWFKILGLDTARHEVDVARYFGELRGAGYAPPPGIDLLLSTSATVYRSERGVNLATISRPMPETLRTELLLPAAHLFTAIAGDSGCLLEEVLRNKSPADAEDFFETVLVRPLHRAWDYFLSLEVPAQGIWGYAAQLHGVNFYHRIDRGSGAITPHIVVKDFGSERVLMHDGSPRSIFAAQKWLLTEYDHYLGALYLTPLLEAFARVSGRKIEYLEEIVRRSFMLNIRPQNRTKFLVQGEAVALHQDAFMQVHDRNLARKELWTSRPRFRPHDVGGYQ